METDGTGITKEVGTVMRSFGQNLVGTELGPDDQTIEEMENSDEQMVCKRAVQSRRQLMKRRRNVQKAGKQRESRHQDQHSRRQRPGTSG